MKYQWYVFLASLDPVRGSEQAGHRPVLVVSREDVNSLLNAINVVPLTSHKSSSRVIYPNEVFLPQGTANIPTDSIALCYQIRTLDKTRLGRNFGKLEDEDLQKAILTAIKFQLQMQ